MLQASREHPHLTAQIVPSPFTLPYDATVQEILRCSFLPARLAGACPSALPWLRGSSTDPTQARINRSIYSL